MRELRRVTLRRQSVTLGAQPDSARDQEMIPLGKPDKRLQPSVHAEFLGHAAKRTVASRMAAGMQTGASGRNKP